MSKELSEARMNPPAYTRGILHGFGIVVLCAATLVFGLYVQALRPMENVAVDFHAYRSPKLTALIQTKAENCIYETVRESLTQRSPDLIAALNYSDKWCTVFIDMLWDNVDLPIEARAKATTAWTYPVIRRAVLSVRPDIAQNWPATYAENAGLIR